MASDANDNCLTKYLSCTSTTTESPEPADGLPPTGSNDSQWYLREGAHRYIGAIIVAVIVVLVIGVYLYVGKHPRRIWHNIMKGRRKGDSEKPPTSVDSDIEKQGPSDLNLSQSPSLDVTNYSKSHQIAPEQIAWMPDKPAPCLKQKSRTVELDWGNAVEPSTIGPHSKRDRPRRPKNLTGHRNS